MLDPSRQEVILPQIQRLLQRQILHRAQRLVGTWDCVAAFAHSCTEQVGLRYHSWDTKDTPAAAAAAAAAGGVAIAVADATAAAGTAVARAVDEAAR